MYRGKATSRMDTHAYAVMSVNSTKIHINLELERGIRKGNDNWIGEDF